MTGRGFAGTGLLRFDAIMPRKGSPASSSAPTKRLPFLELPSRDDASDPGKHKAGCNTSCIVGFLNDDWSALLSFSYITNFASFEAHFNGRCQEATDYSTASLHPYSGRCDAVLGFVQPHVTINSTLLVSPTVSRERVAANEKPLQPSFGQFRSTNPQVFTQVIRWELLLPRVFCSTCSGFPAGLLSC